MLLALVQILLRLRVEWTVPGIAAPNGAVVKRKVCGLKNFLPFSSTLLHSAFLMYLYFVTSL